MEKILSISVAVLFGGLVLVSCDDDSTNEIAAHGLAVVSAQTSFPAAGGTQTIAVAKTPVSYYTNDSWATVAVSGKNVNVTAAENPDRQSRHATVVVKSSEQDSAIVDIDQDGMVVALEAGKSIVLASGDNAGVTSYLMNHNLNVEVSSNADWLTPVVNGDSLSLSYTQNDTGNPRFAWVHYTSGNVTDSLSVLQYETDKDVLGNYGLYYYDFDNSDWYYLNVELYKPTDTTYAMRFNDNLFARLGFSIPVVMDSDYPGFSIQNLSTLGTFPYNNTNYTALMLVLVSDGDGAYYWRSNSLYAHAEFEVDDDGYQYYPVSSVGAAGYEFYEFAMGLSTDGTYNGFTSGGYLTLIDMPYAQFEKITEADDDDASGAKAMNPKVAAHHDRIPARLKWRAPQQLPVSDKTL